MNSAPFFELNPFQGVPGSVSGLRPRKNGPKVAVGESASHFFKKVGEDRAQQARKIVQAIGELPDKHVAFHMLRVAGDFCRMAYLARTTPGTQIADALASFDASVLAVLQRLVGTTLDAQQWQQARLPARLGGLGLRGSQDHSDVAYLSSRMLTKDLCERHRRSQGWDPTVPGSHLGGALARVKSRLTQGPAGHATSESGLKLVEKLMTGNAGELSAGGLQQRLSRSMAVNAHESLMTVAESRGELLTTARMVAQRSEGSGRWFQATPSKTLDKHLTNAEFSTALKLHLGVDVYEEESFCHFCGAVNDTQGIHARSCMGGGDQTLRHNACRDAVHAFCARARLQPRLEAPGLLAETGDSQQDGRRPADVLVCSRLGGPTLAERAGGRASRLHALDFAVVNPMGLSRLSRQRGARPEPLEAAQAYADQKRGRVEAACAAKGVQSHPIVMEVTGGIEKKYARAVFHQIAAAMAEAEAIDEAEALSEIVERISFEITRASAMAVLRRRKKTPAGTSMTAQLMKAAELLEVPEA